MSIRFQIFDMSTLRFATEWTTFSDTTYNEFTASGDFYLTTDRYDVTFMKFVENVLLTEYKVISNRWTSNNRNDWYLEFPDEEHLVAFKLKWG